MPQRETPAPADLAAPADHGPRFLPALVVLFVGSGCAALIYEIVWLQMLSLSLGSSAVSLGVLLGTFMGGMCLGSLLLPVWVNPRHHPVRVYAVLEAAIGASGLLILAVLPVAGRLYDAIGGPGVVGLAARGLIAAVCLLPPTILMGATLPAIARYVEATPRGVSWLGFFYGGNIVGAVLGCLLAGFYLLRVHDVTTATCVAVVINLAVSAIAFAYAAAAPYAARTAAAPAGPAVAPRGTWPVYLAIGLSGLTALGSEVVWTRLLTLLLGGTTYTFSLIMAAFLLGLGVGSAAGAALARSIGNPRAALAACQGLVGVALAWAAYSLCVALPNWPVSPALAPDAMATFQIDLVRSLWVVLPGAVLWGMSFPLALASVASGHRDPGRLVGSVYAANTVGAIVGAMLASLVSIAAIGTRGTQQLLIVAAVVGCLVLVLTGATGAPRPAPRRLLGGAATVALGTLLAAALAASVPAVPPLLVAYGRNAVTWARNHGEFIYVGEGMNSSMAVSREPGGALNYHNAGKIQASSLPQDMRLQRMLGHLTTLVPDDPRKVLVIGCGAGVTAGAVSISPIVERVVIAEIEPLVPRVVSTYFSAHNEDVVRNPKVEVRIDDARHFLLTSRERFDAITSDPFDPWVKGAATLYTKEFFEVMRDHLNPGGVVTVFVQLYESGRQAVKSEIATFLEVFPDGVVFGNTHEGGGYDVVLLARVGGTTIDVDRIERRLNDPRFERVYRSLAEIGFTSGVELLSTFAAQGPQLATWLSDAQINRDRNLRLQYLAGLGINTYEQAAIYSEILACRRIPEDLFTGSPGRLDALRFAILSRSR